MQKGIFLQDLNIKSGTVYNAIITLGDIDDSGKGRKFVSKFIQPGLVKIEGHGIVLLRKETLDESLPTIVGSPVIIQHKDVTEENADKLRCGVIANAYFNQPDGWYYVDGIIWDDKAQDLINKGWSVSCSYDYLAFNDEGGEENNIHYDKEFTQLNFTHLAIVDNPRYERANIVFNSKVKSTEVNNDDQWITIHPNGKDAKGKHLLLKDGEVIDEVTLTEEDKWILTKYEEVLISTIKHMDKYEFNLAGSEIYDFTWNSFCDSYIEFAKLNMNNTTKSVLLKVLKTILKMLHPFMPYVTDELYDKLPIKNSENRKLIKIIYFFYTCYYYTLSF